MRAAKIGERGKSAEMGMREMSPMQSCDELDEYSELPVANFVLANQHSEERLVWIYNFADR